MLVEWVLYASRNLMTWTLWIFRNQIDKTANPVSCTHFALFLYMDQSYISLGGAFLLPEPQTLPLQNTRSDQGNLWGPFRLQNSDLLKYVLVDSSFLFLMYCFIFWQCHIFVRNFHRFHPTTNPLIPAHSCWHTLQQVILLCSCSFCVWFTQYN